METEDGGGTQIGASEGVRSPRSYRVENVVTAGIPPIQSTFLI